jgi:hypothetical protein
MATIHWLRIWEKLGTAKGKLLKNDFKSLTFNGLTVADWRHLYVQILDRDSRPPNLEESNVLMLAQRWHRSSWTVGPLVEVSVPENMLIAQLFEALSRVSGIPLENLKVLALFQFSEVNLCGLEDEGHLNSKSLKWFQKPTDEASARQTVFDWYSSIVHRNSSMKIDSADGTILIIQDASESLRELTSTEVSAQLSITQTGTFFGTDLFHTAAPLSGPVVYRPIARTVEKGITIKSRAEKAAAGEVTPSPEPMFASDSSNFDIF